MCGKTKVSLKIYFAYVFPAMSSNVIAGFLFRMQAIDFKIKRDI